MQDGLPQIVIDKIFGSQLDFADAHYIVEKGCHANQNRQQSRQDEA